MNGLLPDRVINAKLDWYDGELPIEIKYVYAPCVNTIYINRNYPNLIDQLPKDLLKSTTLYVQPADS